jgi:hypothetical protein
MKTFRVTLRAPRDADDAAAVRALRAILKLAWRRFQLRAVDVHEVSTGAAPDEPSAAAPHNTPPKMERKNV